MLVPLKDNKRGLNMADLITKAEYKAYAGISSTNHDAEIDALIPKISQLVKNYCGTGFTDYYSDAKSEEFNGGFQSLILKESPLVQILSVEYSSDFGQNWTELTEYVDWYVDQAMNSVVSTAPSGFPKTPRGFKVTYFAGYESVPVDLKLAVMDLVKYYSRNDGAVHSNRAPTGTGIQIEYITHTQFPAHIKRVLDLYKVDYT